MTGLSDKRKPDWPLPWKRPLGPGPSAAQWPLGWLFLFGLLTIGIPVAFALGFDSSDGLNAFRRHHLRLVGFVAGEPLVASLLFVCLFVLSVAVSLPGVSVLTMVGGFLFGWLEATVYAQVASTVAAGVVFVLARRAFANPLEAQAGPLVRRFADGFKRNALSYVFLLNLVPIFPFGMIIALPAACGVRLWTFVVGAFLGILPGTILLSHLGAGLGNILRHGGTLDLQSFMTPQILVALAGLAALALLPLAFRWLNRQERR